MIHTETIEQYKIARALEEAFEPGSIQEELLSPFEILIKDRDNQQAVFFIDQEGKLQNREKLLEESEIQEIAAEHRKAWEQWPEGGVVSVWRDDDGILCIKYRSGKWYHYKKTDCGLEWW